MISVNWLFIQYNSGWVIKKEAGKRGGRIDERYPAQQ
ncbi:hypothetical protein SPAB_02032 [Salmonella enterica subsp. enterica serovar Paratyphi B str. SPB7]|uniref:Uncharacterized protein n=1 Tax=Salmonella paratyphi B (strain ATCC BAA-1250 / SPB7) TaxID=1016998 RepID=A0A6C6Z2C3_SALPB|nr:hypothetical protein SPAB_02032 [Salmonella enterica subsp. enterica serovar Paratyphi B str. SPB7]